MIVILCSKKFFALILLTMIFSRPAYARDVYVRISNAGSYSIGITEGMLAMTDAEGRIINLGSEALISTSGGYVNIMGNSFLMPVKISGSGFLKFNGRTYRGSFWITQRAGLLNVLDVEQYLYGVLPAEVGASWPAQALRAQAICARTYVLKQSMNRKDKGYDVVDTDADQVYKGQGVETAATNQAVSSTSGEILTYGKDLAYTYFHSDSGGHTADISDVWGQKLPYLTGVPEIVNYKSPVASWTAKISSTKIQNAIKKITGTDIGNITEIQVSEVDQGGRANKMTFIGTKGTKTIKASQFRTNVDPRTLKSTMLTPSGGAFKIDNTTTPSGLVSKQRQTQTQRLTFNEEQGLAQMTAEGVFSTTELLDMLSNPNKLKEYYAIGLGRSKRVTTELAKSAAPKSKYGYSIEKSGDDFIFYGRGWGHGVGMSQWGAMAMAEQGYTAEKILLHYYPGTAIKKFK